MTDVISEAIALLWIKSLLMENVLLACMPLSSCRLSTLNVCSKSKTWLCVSNCQTGTTDLNTMPGLSGPLSLLIPDSCLCRISPILFCLLLGSGSGAMCWTTRCAGREANLQAAGACRPFGSLLRTNRWPLPPCCSRGLPNSEALQILKRVSPMPPGDRFCSLFGLNQ